MTDKQTYELHEYYRKQISGQSRKITKLLKENKKLRIMLKQLTAITVELDKAYRNLGV